MSYSLHPDAEDEIAEAIDFYLHKASTTVADRFATEVERVIALLVENPKFGTTTTLGRRIYPLRVFPYSIVYREIEDGIRILIVRHQHRRPAHGSTRH